ncbi:MAG: hypothetical protein LC739_12050 [Actinobacteria bacterium]|nr:hypothetical protein [Actinomycetota bacterium]
MLARLKVSEVAVIVTLLVVTVVPSFFHALAGFGSTGNYSVFDITLETVYTESIPFMALALLIGLLAPTAGAGFVASFAVIDLIASAIAQQELTPFLPRIRGPTAFLLVAVAPGGRDSDSHPYLAGLPRPTGAGISGAGSRHRRRRRISPHLGLD